MSEETTRESANRQPFTTCTSCESSSVMPWLHVHHDRLLLECLRDGHERAQCLELAAKSERDFDGDNLAGRILHVIGGEP